MTNSEPDPPEHVPETVVTALEECSDTELREIIHYAQQQLRDHQSLTDTIESREGERLVRRDDFEGYTIVIMERPEEPGWARGPFAYRVKWERTPDDTDGQYRWHYLGHVDTGSGGA